MPPHRDARLGGAGAQSPELRGPTQHRADLVLLRRAPDVGLRVRQHLDHRPQLMAMSGWQLAPGRGSLRGMTMSPNPYRGFRFPPEVIQRRRVDSFWMFAVLTFG